MFIRLPLLPELLDTREEFALGGEPKVVCLTMKYYTDITFRGRGGALARVGHQMMTAFVALCSGRKVPGCEYIRVYSGACREAERLGVLHYELIQRGTADGNLRWNISLRFALTSEGRVIMQTTSDCPFPYALGNLLEQAFEELNEKQLKRIAEIVPLGSER